MTKSWRPSVMAHAEVDSRYPGLDYRDQALTFRDWHIGQGTSAKTESQWDALFLSWCSMKHEKAPEAERFHDNGMPINPRPPVYADEVPHGEAPEERES